METRLILIEGLPGSGKTTTAEWICEWLRETGAAAEWFLETLHDHPVIDRPTLKTPREPGYVDRCVSRWRAFADAVVDDPASPVQVLEGCFFQSTVRFLLEHDHPDGEPERARARRHGWVGREGLVEFYAHYREVCDGLVARCELPVLEIDTSTDDWVGLRNRLTPWLAEAS